MVLTPCVACHRHVAITEHACPFCGGGLARPRRPSKLGRVSRAVVFASAAVASAACGKKAKQPDTKTQQATPTDAAVDPSSKPADATVDPAVEEVEPRRRPTSPNMPYGAPPARKRYV
jgi:hypothetical protein